MPLEKVRKVLKLAREPLSIETPVGDEEDGAPLRAPSANSCQIHYLL
jgi:DNA-directed RNA polymerase sigma subunit (sigma70/sigma32)